MNMGISMNKIKEFLTTEKNNLKVERKEKESNIYRCELNIASINDAIKKLETWKYDLSFASSYGDLQR